MPVKADSASETAREASSAVCSRTPWEEYCAGSRNVIWSEPMRYMTGTVSYPATRGKHDDKTNVMAFSHCCWRESLLISCPSANLHCLSDHSWEVPPGMTGSRHVDSGCCQDGRSPTGANHCGLVLGSHSCRFQLRHTEARLIVGLCAQDRIDSVQHPGRLRNGSWGARFAPGSPTPALLRVSRIRMTR